MPLEGNVDGSGLSEASLEPNTRVSAQDWSSLGSFKDEPFPPYVANQKPSPSSTDELLCPALAGSEPTHSEQSRTVALHWRCAGADLASLACTAAAHPRKVRYAAAPIEKSERRRRELRDEPAVRHHQR